MNFTTFKSLFEIDSVKEIPNTVTQHPIVSVCVQTYNQERFISRCIESILAQQTSFTFEILLADDDSSDNTRIICSNYANQNKSKIRYLIHSRKNNINVLGKASANFPVIYNFFSARGKYIAICEGDDYWNDPLKLQKQYDFMNSHPEYSICYHSFKPIDISGKKLNTNLVSPLRRDLKAEELLFPWVHPAVLTVFFRNIFMSREIPKEATEVLTLDAFLYSILGNYGPGKYLSNISDSYYRIGDKSLWSNRDLEYKLLNKINTYKKIAKYYKRIDRSDFTKIFRSRILKLRLYLSYYYIKNFHYQKILRNWF